MRGASGAGEKAEMLRKGDQEIIPGADASDYEMRTRSWGMDRRLFPLFSEKIGTIVHYTVYT